jgi:hypothetical protein
MDKIKDLLKQLGGSPELIEEITKELAAFKAQCLAEADATLQANLVKAKQVCLEEVVAEKANLRRKVEIFLEARINSIDRDAEKQAAIGESEAVKMLRGIQSLLEGVDNNSTPETQAAVAEVKKLRVLVNKFNEDKAQLVETAKRANQIAMKALQRNKMLESKNLPSKPQPEDSAKPANLGAVRIESSEPKTTRKVLVESQIKAPEAGKPAQADGEVAAIAAGIESMPAFME